MDSGFGSSLVEQTGYLGATIKSTGLNRNTDVLGEYIVDASGDYECAKMDSSVASVFVNSRRTYNKITSRGLISR